MAISPKQLNENFMKEVDSYEKAIDARLSLKKLPSSGSISINIPSGMSHEHLQILKPRYLYVGWKEVRWEFDQREGDNWLVFEL